jgi:predicted ATPase
VLERVSLKGFKLHEATSLDFAPVSVLIGPNNSGKSSVFQALLALRQACARATPSKGLFLAPAQRQEVSERQPFLFSAEQLVDIGEFKDVLREGQNQVEIGVSGSLSGLRPSALGELHVNIEVEIRDNALASHEGGLRFSGGRLEWKHVSRAPGAFPPPSVRLDDLGSVLKFGTVDDFGLIQPAGYDLPPDADPAFVSGLTQASASLATAHIELLKSLHPIYPLRGFEEWGSLLPEQPPKNVERVALADRAVAIASLLASDSRLRRQVSERLQELLGIGIEIEIVYGKRVKIYGTPAGISRTETLFANEGTGANQLPFILAPIGLANANETIFLSEPEAHLHPRKQSDLVGLLLKVAETRNLQFVIETHSEHVLHRLLHSVAIGELRTDELVIYYFEDEKGAAKVRRLAINDLGQVDGGLPGFFDQSLAELSEYLDALKKT